ncbi:class II aldolase/adducin family protein [Pacificimonas sp. ICDLI1SI03]
MLKAGKRALLKKHGVFIVASNIWQAYSRAIKLEHRCRIAWHFEVLAKGPPITTPESPRVVPKADQLVSLSIGKLWPAARSILIDSCLANSIRPRQVC